MPDNLTLEQELAIRAFQLEVEKIEDTAILKRKIVDIYRQILVSQNTYLDAIKHKWGIEIPDINQ
jgi:hypothetical protein